MDSVQATLITGAIAGTLAIWGVMSQRAISRRKATIDLLTGTLNDSDYIKALDVFSAVTKTDSGLLPYAEVGQNDCKEGRAIQTILNNFELISIGIQRGVIDYQIFDRYSHSTVISYWEISAPFITRLRIRTGITSLYQEFEQLYKWISGENPAPKRNRFWATIF